MKPYELIEHTADIGIRVKAAGLPELFKNTASAMFDLIARKEKPSSVKKIIIKQKANNPEELFINWLNELLSLSSAKGLIFSDFKITRLDANSLEAVCLAGDIDNYEIKSEIKAATYHQLKLEELACGWQAEVIFDV